MPQGLINMPQIGRSVTHTVQAKNIIAEDIWSNSINMKRTEIETQRVDDSEINYLKVKKQAEICADRIEDNDGILIVENLAFNNDLNVDKTAVDIRKGNFYVKDGRSEFTNYNCDIPTVTISNEGGSGCCALTITKGDFCFENGNLVLNNGDTILNQGNVIIEDGYIDVTYIGNTGDSRPPLTINNVYNQNAIYIVKGDIYNDNGDIILYEGDITLTNGDIALIDGDVTLNEGNVTLNDGDITVNNGSIEVTTNNQTDIAINITQGNINVGGRQINNIELNAVKGCSLIQSSLGAQGISGAPLYDISIYGLGNNMYIKNITSAQGGNTGNSDQKYSFVNRIGFKSNPLGELGETGLDLNQYKSILVQLFTYSASGTPELLYAANNEGTTEIPICIQDLTNNEYAIQYNFSVDDTLIEGKDIGLIYWKLIPHSWSSKPDLYLTEHSTAGEENILFDEVFTNYNRLSYVRMNYDEVNETYKEAPILINDVKKDFDPLILNTLYNNLIEFNNNHRQVRVAIVLYTGTKNAAGVVPDEDLCAFDKWIELSYIYDSYIEADITSIPESHRIHSNFFKLN